MQSDLQQHNQPDGYKTSLAHLLRGDTEAAVTIGHTIHSW